MHKKKILFLFYRTPFNYFSGNDRRQYLIYSTVSKNFETRILTFGEENHEPERQEVIRLKKSNFKKIINFLLKLQSPRITHYQSKEFRIALEECLKTFNPDFIYVEHLLMMQYVLNINTSAKIVFFNDESNLFVSYHKLRNNLYEKIRNLGLGKMDLEASRKADFVFTITKEEETFLSDYGVKNIETIPYGIDAEYFSFNWQKPDNKSILFLGDFGHYPNREAVKILSEKILPALSERKLTLKIVGRNVDRVKKYCMEKVEAFDSVEDVRLYYWNSSVFVAPIFSGAGLRVKIMEAALCGIPLIITPASNLGINLVDNEETFVCNSIQEIVQKLNVYFSSKIDDKSDQMRIKARDRIVANFDERVIKKQIVDIFEKISS